MAKSNLLHRLRIRQNELELRTESPWWTQNRFGSPMPVDVRQDQRYLAEKDLFPCGDRDESRFLPDFEVPLSVMGMEVIGDPNIPREISYVKVLNGQKRKFEGLERVVLANLLEFIKVHDPDVILFPYADTWVPLIVKKARLYGLEPTFSRTGWFKQMASLQRGVR